MKNLKNKNKITLKRFKKDKKENIDEFDPILIIITLVSGIAFYVIAKDPFGTTVFGKILKPISLLLLTISNALNL